MLAVLLGALSALSYGAADFTGAVASKENDSTIVTIAMQVVSLVLLILVIVAFGGSSATARDWAWGAVAGLAAGLALVTFYRALAIGPMSTAASITALISATIPVAVGLGLGDRPSAITLAGVALAIPAAVLVSIGGTSLRGSPTNTTPRERVAGAKGTSQTRTLAVIAGLGFGLFFVALARTSAEAGLVPLVGARLASIAALAILLSATKTWAPIKRSWWWLIALTGGLDFGANSLYLIALRYGSFTWVAAISSLYPVSTVLLARAVLKEEIARLQIVGLVASAAALTLVAVGVQ